jgi:hypothetical protein
MNIGDAASHIGRYYRAMAGAWLGKLPETDDELNAWCNRQLVLLWNEPSPLEVTLGQFLTASSEAGKGVKAAGAQAPPLILAMFLFWPLLALARSRQPQASQWMRSWSVVLRRPDLLLAVSRGPFTEKDHEETLSALLHIAVNMYLHTHHPSPTFRLDHKPHFHAMCVRHGLPTVPIVDPSAVDPDKRYIAKPRASAQARGIFTLMGSEVVAKLDVETHFIQPCLQNPPELAALVGPGAGLCTLRIATLRPPQGEPVVLGVFARLARSGAVVDNFHAGGVGCPVDLDSGQLKAGTMDERKRANWQDAWSIREHPDTGIPFADRFVFPHFERAKELCTRAHQVLAPDAMLCSWDVACMTEGPVLVEVSPSLGGSLELMHRPDARLYRETLKHAIRSVAGEVQPPR